ncbi:uncharacterized protein LOC113324775 [Papaver somniferum]|uniref:uncharacterized protein LOC113324775 n=1 Tax=Papaver somniferum TaxID=3469 RepID=UPI000E702361|nr:uncharacterized protein LOC113324775 [Papaver somniferum]
MAEELVKYYEQKFQFQHVSIEDSLLSDIPEVITQEDQEMLDKLPDEKEIKSIIFDMDPDSSPGPDGFSGCFYKACAKSPNKFRPIGLSNVSFKNFTKIITARLSNLLVKLISPQQAAYVKGRCIQEQIMLASELVNEIKKKRRGGNIGLKLDISQAYDSVSWEFLFQVLQKFGFLVLGVIGCILYLNRLNSQFLLMVALVDSSQWIGA